MERTLAIIKPDAVVNAKPILQRIRKAAFNVVAKKKRHLDKDDAAEFYAEHRNKPFFQDLVAYITSGPCIVLVLSKRRAISSWRSLIGPTNADNARQTKPKWLGVALVQVPSVWSAQCLRALYGTDANRNGLHGSDSYVSAEREIRLMFPKLETKPLPDQIRNYLAVEVNHVLATALAELCAAKPDDPLLWLAEWLHRRASEKGAGSQAAAGALGSTVTTTTTTKAGDTKPVAASSRPRRKPKPSTSKASTKKTTTTTDL